MLFSFAAVNGKHPRPRMGRTYRFGMQKPVYAQVIGIEPFAKGLDFCIDALVAGIEPGLFAVIGNSEVLPKIGGGHQDGLLNFLIAGTPADIALYCFFYIFQAGVGIFIQQAFCADDHTRGAIAALNSSCFCKAIGIHLLLTFAQPLDGGYRFPFKLGKRDSAGFRFYPIDQDGTGTTGTLAAPILGAGKVKVLTEESK